jgi:hypothetical protein
MQYIITSSIDTSLTEEIFARAQVRVQAQRALAPRGQFRVCDPKVDSCYTAVYIFHGSCRLKVSIA